MMLLYVVFGLLAASGSDVDRTEKLKFRFGDHWVEFVRQAKGHFTVSAACVHKSGVLACDAYSALKQASLRDLDSELSGGIEPGAVVCDKRLKAKVVLGVDGKRNENSFCLLGDGSMVSLGGLAYHARKNDSAK
ncbi:MAG: hypothetical protein HY074_01965 [Deltaproteobacteria bacterium]|nr:hypothetical protein [Deltaproteobacteria bacterium]